MSQKTFAYINPEILKWARDQCGFTLEEAASSYLSPEKLRKVEEGLEKLTFNQFINLSNRFKRVPAFFYLKEPPKEELVEDFRTLPSTVINFSPNLRAAIFLVKEKRELAVRFKEYDLPHNYSYINSISQDENPEIITKHLGQILDISMTKRKRWKTDYEALKGWIEAIEKVGTMVFQLSGIDINEMRGFSISEIPYPVIVLNRSDSPLGRIFTLIHEFCHLMFKKGGICTLTHNDEGKFKIEEVCNAVAGNVLVPKNEFLKIPLVKDHETEEWDYSDLDTLKKIFWASQEVILRRLLLFNKTTTSFYQRKREEWQNLARISSGGAEEPYKKVLSTNSNRFIKILLSAMYENNITMADVSRYLKMSLKHLNKLETYLEG